MSDDDKTCRSASTDLSTTTQRSIVVELLPTDCLWSEWSDWSPCSATCGESAFRTRNRKVVIPARNGGSCQGKDLESWDCPPRACESSTTTTTTEETIVTEADFGDKVTPTTTTEAPITEQPVSQSTRDEPRKLDIEPSETTTEAIDAEDEEKVSTIEQKIETTTVTDTTEVFDEITTTEKLVMTEEAVTDESITTTQASETTTSKVEPVTLSVQEPDDDNEEIDDKITTTTVKATDDETTIYELVITKVTEKAPATVKDEEVTTTEEIEVFVEKDAPEMVDETTQQPAEPRIIPEVETTTQEILEGTTLG